jgi:cysteine-rich repeat protein
MMGGEGSGAAPSAGSAGTGQMPSEGGAEGEPMTGDGGADEGTGGAPPEPPEPVCGNGKLEGTEECDDGGHAGKDGCSANCEVVCSDFDDEESEAVESADGHCYNGYDSADFEGAQAACAELGGHLATISSAAENEIAAGFVNNSKFIGGFEALDAELIDERDGSKGTYQWVTGEAFDYENWGQEQPDQDARRCSGGFTGDWCYSHCASMDGAGNWRAQRCDLEDGYVCEWEPAGD